jgi:hypothetical protein
MIRPVPPISLAHADALQPSRGEVAVPWMHRDVMKRLLPAIQGVIAIGLIFVATTLVEAIAQDLRTEDLDLSLKDTEPVITVKRERNHIAEEYWVDNQLRMVKITPRVGAPYFIVDPDGDGVMGMRRNSPGMDVAPTQWRIFSW